LDIEMHGVVQEEKASLLLQSLTGQRTSLESVDKTHT